MGVRGGGGAETPVSSILVRFPLDPQTFDVETHLAGLPAHSSFFGTRHPGGTTVPAAICAPSSMTEPSATTAPAPTLHLHKRTHREQDNDKKQLTMMDFDFDNSTHGKR